MVRLPRLIIAAPASGHGKTTVATGLMAALRSSGHRVSGHKVGPDFIDPGYHALATGLPGRNLDPYLMGEDLMAPLLIHGAHGADLAIIEGVMGLYDGRIGADGDASTAHLAALTQTPVVLVVDISHASRSVAAVVHGMMTFDPSVRVVGLILNKAGSDRHAGEVIDAVAPLGIPVLGVLRRDDGIVAPSRHLGLLPAAERPEARQVLDRLADQIRARVDLPRLVALAATAPDLDAQAWRADDAIAGLGRPSPQPTQDRPAQPRPAQDRPLVALAGGRSFTFRYAETVELLEAAGCEVVEFDPLHDEHLPERTRGLYLGGGFPEVHASALGANQSLLEGIREAVTLGMPTVAECAGMLYLCRSLDGVPMAGALSLRARMSSRLTLAYRRAATARDSVLGPAGMTVTGHEFHRTMLDEATTPGTGWQVEGGELIGVSTPTLHASYLHTHWAGYPQLAAGYARAVHASSVFAPASPTRRKTADPMPLTSDSGGGSTGRDTTRVPDVPAPPSDPLRHHGDVEAPGLVDFAVNVYDGAWPQWLESTVLDSLADARHYPDARQATAAVAAHHGRDADEVIVTSGAAEAFGLIARLRPWRRPVVVHPQFTEPDVALTMAGHRPDHVFTDPANGFVLDPDLVPADADLVVIGNPTNPTSVLHPARLIQRLLRPGRVVLVDEAFMDSVPSEIESLAEHCDPGLLVVRSLTKLWSVPGLRAGYVLGDAALIHGLAKLQAPWSVSTPALAVMRACTSEEARSDAASRASIIEGRRAHLTDGLTALGIEFVADPRAPFVLARPGPGVHGRLRAAGIAVRRADTFPGLDDSWIRIAVRARRTTQQLLERLSIERTTVEK